MWSHNPHSDDGRQRRKDEEEAQCKVECQRSKVEDPCYREPCSSSQGRHQPVIPPSLPFICAQALQSHSGTNSYTHTSRNSTGYSSFSIHPSIHLRAEAHRRSRVAHLLGSAVLPLNRHTQTHTHLFSHTRIPSYPTIVPSFPYSLFCTGRQTHTPVGRRGSANLRQPPRAPRFS